MHNTNGNQLWARRCAYYTAFPTTLAGPNINLTVPSFLPRPASFGSLFPDDVPRGRGGCSFSLMAILRRISWSGLYGTGPGATCEERCWFRGEGCGEGDDGVLGDVLAEGFCAAWISRSRSMCDISAGASDAEFTMLVNDATFEVF